MHFLAHYYTELPANNPLFVAGLSIPDLTPHFIRAYHRYIARQTKQLHPAHRQIHNGIMQHLEGDKKFHSSVLFKEHVSLTKASFLKAGLSTRHLRLSVLAHIAVEMLIDRHILLSHPDISADYYDLLEKADESIISSYFDLFLLENEKQIFLSRFRFYKQRKFLLLFGELENIITGLDKVYGSVTKTEFTPQEKLKFLTALNNIDGILRYSWQKILNE